MSRETGLRWLDVVWCGLYVIWWWFWCVLGLTWQVDIIKTLLNLFFNY